MLALLSSDTPLVANKQNLIIEEVKITHQLFTIV